MKLMNLRIMSLLVMLIVAASLLMGGCAKPAPTPAPTPKPAPAPKPKEPVKIGGLLPLTGPASLGMDWMKAGADFALHEVGYEISGRKIEIMWEDTEGKPDIGLDKARKLVETDKVNIIIGPLMSDVAVAIAPYVSQKMVPMISIGALPASVVEKYDWVFAPNGSFSGRPYGLGRFAVEKLGYKTISIITFDLLQGREFARGFLKGFTEAGGEVTQEQYIPFTMDMSPYLAKIGEPDAVAVWLFGIFATRFLTQYQEYGLYDKAPLLALNGTGFIDSMFLKGLKGEAADAVVGIIGNMDYSSKIKTDINKKFVQAFREKYERAPTSQDMYAYLPARVIIETLKATDGDTLPVKLHRAMLDLEIETAKGPFRFDPSGIGVGTMYVIKVDRVAGEWVFPVLGSYETVPGP